MTILRRRDLEAREHRILAPYAMKADRSRGRIYDEAQDDFRTEFQRDRDRVLHSAAFRRMEYKTQVFVNHEGDHYRTRLTHSLEVAQIARTVGRLLCLNEDLMEALVLAHDLGHTPFGHAGERVLAELTQKHGKFAFEHNAQSLRIVEVLEHRYPEFPGLNLTFEVREGIAKHSQGWKPESLPKDLSPQEQPSLEAQLIDIVDEIAYNNHDVDDGLSSQMIPQEELDKLEIWAASKEKVLKKHNRISKSELKYRTISQMMTALIQDLVEQTWSRIQDQGIVDDASVRAHSRPLAGFSPKMAALNQSLKIFLREHLYTHYRVIRMEEKAKRIMTDLFEAYLSRPEQIPGSFFDDYKEESTVRTIADYIAGMTDRFAIDEHQKLFDPHTKV